MRYRISPFLAAFLTIVLTITPVALAISEEEDRAECMDFLGLTEVQIQLGTFRIRLDDCIDEKQLQRHTSSKLWRLQQRALKTQQRLKRNSRMRTYRKIEEPETDVEFNQRRKDALAEVKRQRDLHRYRVRPSVRLLRQQKEISTREARKQSSNLYQQRWKTAIEACRNIPTRFHNNNCVRAKLRELGTR